MSKTATFFLIFLLGFFPLFAMHKNACSSAKLCLNRDLEGCSAKDKKAQSKINYNQDFCAPFVELKNRGMDLHGEIAREVYGRLGQKYRAIYVSEGVLDVSPPMMSYLFDHMPFTAKLINAYQGSTYSIRYNAFNRRVFSGTNGRSLSGDFIWVAQDSAGHKLGFRNVFFGVGRAKILKWNLQGTAVAFLDMDPVSKHKTKYKLTAVVFPGNSVLNSIMKMDVFKKVVEEKIDYIIKDIQKASTRYAKGDKSPIFKNKELKNPEDAVYLKEFEAVVNGDPWVLGDYFKKKGVHAPGK